MDRLSPQAQANLIAANKAGKELAQAKIAAKRAQFDVDEPALLAKAKKLNAAGKYGQTVDLGNEYMWAGDEALNQEVSIARDKQVAIAMQVAKREAKKQGVRIGMSKQDVLDSSWGRPEHINTTTTSNQTSEQWVYSGYHSYLYFTDGVLTAIQN